MREHGRFRGIERRLEERRGRLLDRLAAIARELSPGPEAPTSDTGGCPTLAAIIAMSRRELAQVDRSLARLRAGEYGACLRCHAPIRLAALHASPHRLCCEACGGVRASERCAAEVEPLDALLVPVAEEVDRVATLLGRADRHGRPAVPALGAARSATAMLSDFRLRLADVFDHEVDRGPLHDALVHAPRLTRPARRLAGEHTALLARADRLLEEARGAGAWPERWRFVRSGWRALSAELIAHQRAEEALCAAAFLNDIGGG